MFEKKNETQNCPVLHTHTYTHKKKTLFSVFKFIMGPLYSD